MGIPERLNMGSNMGLNKTDQIRNNSLHPENTIQRGRFSGEKRRSPATRGRDSYSQQGGSPA